MGMGDDPGRDGQGPLAGVRVLELGSFIAGPFSGQLLGDYGAEIIKVEPPGEGDPMRRWGITRDGDSLWWPAIGRNKRSVTLDLRDERARAVVRRLAAACDIVIENFRPGRLDEWGLGYDVLAAANPAVVLVHISGFGQTGPRAGEAGFGSIGEAVGGIRYTTGSPDRPPSRAGVSLGDALAAMFGVIGVAGRPHRGPAHRPRPGGRRGHLRGGGGAHGVVDGRPRAGRRAARALGQHAARCVARRTCTRRPTASEVVIAGNADSVFGRLCEAMGQPELRTDERYATHGARGANMAELDERIGAWTVTLPAAELLERLEAHGVPAGQIFTAREMLARPAVPGARDGAAPPLVPRMGGADERHRAPLHPHAGGRAPHRPAPRAGHRRRCCARWPAAPRTSSMSWPRQD